MTSSHPPHLRLQAFGTEMTLDPLLMRLNKFTGAYDLDLMIDNLYKVRCSGKVPSRRDKPSKCF
jgi:hypothetical protein